MLIYKCDRKGCESTAETPRGQRNAGLPTGWYTVVHGDYRNGRNYHLCPDCRKALDIPDGYGKATDHVGDHLLEIISEIVSEELQNQ